MTAPRAFAVVVGILAIPGVAVAAPFHAEPAVRVVEVAANGSGTGAIVLRNDGPAAVVATSITATPGCDSAVVATPLTGFTLAAGATRSIAISCTPAPPGMQRCTYQVHGAGNAVLLDIEAVCASGNAATLATNASAVDFGAVTVGSTAARTLLLTHSGTAAFDRLSFHTTDLAGSFTVAAPCNPDGRACDAQVAPVAPGDITSVVVACTPRAPGPQTAQLHITTSAGTRLATPIALTCTGLAVDVPVLTASPTELDLGTVEQINATATTTVRLANAGTGTLQLLGVQIVDAGTGAAPDWSYTARAPCSPSIPAPPPGLATCPLEDGEAVDLELTFDPNAIGVRDATLLVNYHDTADRSISIPLHGVGSGATLELVGGSDVLDFGTLPLGTPASLTVEVVNRGTRALTGATAAVTPPVAAFSVSPATFNVPAGARVPITVTCTAATAADVTGAARITATDVRTNLINLQLRCTGDPAMTVTATPPAILLGEVRVATEAIAQVALASLGGPIELTGAALAVPDPRLTLGNVSAMTPATLALTAAPNLEGPLTNQLVITPATGPVLTVEVTGNAVAAAYAVPSAISLGTFCVRQPTTPRTVALVSTGTATLGVSAPALDRADSPFDLALVAPLGFPAELPMLARAVVTVTPKRQTVPGMVSDVLRWTTDAGDPGGVSETLLSATFVDDGPAVAPTSIAFPATTIHLDNGKPQPVTLRNCSSSTLQLDPPQIAAPFTIDGPMFPGVLTPGETATFGVGFHPTKTGPVSKDLVITSPQLRNTTFIVMLSGEGIAEGSGSGSGSIDADFDSTSFYACGSCATNDASGALALALAVICVVVPRRRRATGRSLRP